MEAEDGGMVLIWGPPGEAYHTHRGCYLYKYACEDVDLNVSVNYIIINLKVV